jgi:DNA excision repair protein ERCC-2
MRICWEHRQLSIAAGELAALFSAAGAMRGGDSCMWRMDLGREWHSALRQRAARGKSAARFEVAVAGTLHCAGWQLAIEGRIDQLISQPAGDELREIKTVRDALPCDADDLRARYPAYFLQTTLYAALWAQQAAPASGLGAALVVFVGIADGITQAVALTTVDEQALADHLQAVAAWLEARRAHGGAWRRWAGDQTPFAAWRDGQQAADSAVATALSGPHRHTLFQAPTGFGKTGIALHQGLRLVHQGLVDRIVFLSGKRSGQQAAAGYLEAVATRGAPLRYLVLHSRGYHETHGVAALDGTQRAAVEARWRTVLPKLGDQFEQGTVSFAAICRLAQSCGVSSWEVSRALLAWADVWIFDYNYVFHPTIQAFPDTVPGFERARSLLIIDEAHNLASRIADNWGVFWHPATLRQHYTELSFHRAGRECARELERLLRWLSKLPCKRVVADEHMPWLDEWIGRVAQLAARAWPDVEADAPGARAAVEFLLEGTRLLAEPRLPRLTEVTADGSLHSQCLTIAPVAGDGLAEWQRVVLMSATLDPIDGLCLDLGLDAAACGWVDSTAPWQAGALQFAVDVRVDTRLAARSAHMTTTAITVQRMVEEGTAPVAVFLPSFAYAEALEQELAVIPHGLRIVLQPRTFADEESALAFLEMALETADALLIVLGSRFGESIDALGGRVQAALVVGPALPEVNHLNEARVAAAGSNRRLAFRRVYMEPGIRKVRQAVGRLVRAPGHRATVVLHCQRFAQPEYQQLLPAAWRNSALIVEDGDLASWLTGQHPATANQFAVNPATTDGEQSTATGRDES